MHSTKLLATTSPLETYKQFSYIMIKQNIAQIFHNICITSFIECGVFTGANKTTKFRHAKTLIILLLNTN